MKKQMVTLLFLLAVAVGYGQSDTIFSNNERIICFVKEVTPEAVKFVYPEEEVINSIYKNSVQKIVFKNGRTQVFSEALAMKKVIVPGDYENVTITQVDGEVNGLFKLGEISSKAKGATTLSNQERVKERAYRKLKMEAAMMGANVVYLLHHRDQGNQLGGYYQSGSSAETSLTGVAYSNELPDFDAFNKRLNGKMNFIAEEEVSLWNNGSDLSRLPFMGVFDIYSITNQNGLIVINGTLQGEYKISSFGVVAFDETHFYVYYEKKNASYNVKVRI
jgi:hypothetical protein